MKKTTLLVFGLLSTGLLLAQDNTDQEIPGETVYIRNAGFEISRPLREIAAENPIDESIIKSAVARDDRDRRVPPQKVNPNALPLDGIDPIAQTIDGTMMPPRAPIANWQGMSGSGFPPDPSGAAGPNHYVQGVNTSFRVYDKTGTGMASAASLNTLWSGSTNDGDPIILYDKYADRWFISQFNSPNEVLVAISTTPDPLGTYYSYTFIPSSGQFPDYPKYSIWWDGYYLCANYTTKRVTVLERQKMLTGDPTAGMLVKTLSPLPPSNGFFCMLPADADGTLPPNGTPCYIFSYEDDGWASSSQDAIRIYKITTDWAGSNLTVTADATLPTTAFNAAFASNWQDIPQPGVSQKLDAIGGVLNYRAQYRVWTGYNSVVLCHAVWVNQGAAQAGVRWYELRQIGTTWTIYQQGTYAPTTDSRWLGSIAMDDYGNIGLAYAISSTTTSPGLRYTGRLSTDPLGQMTLAEQTAIAGSGAQTGTERFGDYSHTSLDPDGATFWHTGEYVSTSKRTRIYSFRIAGSVSTNNIVNTQAVFNAYQSNQQIIVKGENLFNNDEIQVDLFDIQGKLISGNKLIPADNNFQTTISSSGLSAGAYLVRIGNINFQRVIKLIIAE